MKAISIYIHIPFCVSKCAYCDFVSYKPSSEKIVDAYMSDLIEEIIMYEDVLRASEIKTIYFGGGTPSSIDSKWIIRVIQALKDRSPFAMDCEITLEVNPGTLTLEKINDYLSAGINRVSMGLQTSNDTLLKSIGRIHSSNDFITTYNALRDAGFKNISLDLMFGLPGQTLEDIRRSIALIHRLQPEHVSAYGLKLEEGTPMYEAYNNGRITLVDEAVEREMYHIIDRELNAQNINAYELSNFAKPGYESKHNLVYWKNQPYLGLGVSAHSKLNGVRFGNSMTLKDYQERITRGEKPIETKEVIDQEDDCFETIMLGLRLNVGINVLEINEKYSIHFMEKYKGVIKTLVDDSLVKIEGDTIKLTPLGRDLANRVFLAFYPEK